MRRTGLENRPRARVALRPLGVAIGIVLALAPSPPSPLRAGDEPAQRWVFEPGRETAGGRIPAASGELVGRLLDGATLEPGAPGSATSPGSPGSLRIAGPRGRVLVAEELGRAALPGGALSVEAWVMAGELGPWSGIAGALQDNGGFEKGWLLGTRDQRFVFALSTRGADDGDGRMTYLSADTAFEPDHWYHVVGTWDGASQRIWVDGAARGLSREQSGDVLYPESGRYVLGAYLDENELHPFRGRIAEIRVWGRALSPGEIREHFDEAAARFAGIRERDPDVPAWPTYRRDVKRTGLSSEPIELPLRRRWTWRAALPPAPAWPPPARQDYWHDKQSLRARVVFDRAFHVVSDGERVVFGSTADDNVRALDVRTGRELWSFAAEGPVRLAPTIDGDRVLFGSDDGCVYAIRRSDGALQWTRRIVPTDRRIPGCGRLISPWPVRSGVLVESGVAWATAGIFPEQGCYQVALDAVTGREIARGDTGGVSPQGYLRKRGARLLVPAGRAPEAMVGRLERRGKARGVDMRPLQAFPFEMVGAPGLRFGGGDGEVAAFDSASGRLLWRAEVEGKAWSLALSAGCLVASTDRGVVHCFEPERGALRPRSGEPEVEPAVRSGAGATRRRLVPGSGDAATRSAERIVEGLEEAAGVTGVADIAGIAGYGLVVGDPGARLAAALAARTRLRLVVLERDPAEVTRARRELISAGLHGSRVVVWRWRGDRLPLADAILNLVAARPPEEGRDPVRLPAEEVRRVLRPDGGLAMLGGPAAEGRATVEALPERGLLSPRRGRWLRHVRPGWAGVGEWTHLYADAANRSSSGDLRVGGALRLRWFGPPGPRPMIDRHHRTVAPLAADGRLLVPGDERIFAVDLYNGAPLWEADLRGSRRVGIGRDAGSLALGAGRLWVASVDRCRALDLRSGRVDREVSLPAGGRPTERWGWIAVSGATLFGSGVRAGASRTEVGKSEISGFYYDRQPVVTSDRVFAVDAVSGEVLWSRAARTGVVVNSTLAVVGGACAWVESRSAETLRAGTGRFPLPELVTGGADLVAVSAATREVLWRSEASVRRVEHALYLAGDETGG